MSQHGTENQSHNHPESASRQDGKANHIAISISALSAIVTAIWVAPSVVENWDHLWMKLLLVLFGFAAAYFVFAIFRQAARWERKKALLAAGSIGLTYFIILGIAWIGGDVPAIFSAIRGRFAIPILLTMLTIFSWIWAFYWRPRPASASPAVTQPDQPNTVIASAARILINDGSDRNHGIWIVACRQPEQTSKALRIPETMRPVPLAIFLQLVNRTGATLTIYRSKIEYEDKSGKWKETTATPVSGKGYMFKPLVMINGFNPASINQINLEAWRDFSTQVDQRNIASGDAVSGWLFLDATENLTGKKLRFRMQDVANREYISSIQALPPMPDEDCEKTISFGGFAEDISNAKVEVPWGPNAAPATQTTQPDHTSNSANQNDANDSLASTGALSAPKKLSDGRIVVQLDREAIRKAFQDHMKIHAEKLFQHFIGKWTETAGVVKDVSESLGTLSLDLEDSLQKYPRFLLFFEMSSAGSLEILSRGNQVRVRGEIYSIGEYTIHLRKCEVI